MKHKEREVKVFPSPNGHIYKSAAEWNWVALSSSLSVLSFFVIQPTVIFLLKHRPSSEFEIEILVVLRDLKKGFCGLSLEERKGFLSVGVLFIRILRKLLWNFSLCVSHLLITLKLKLIFNSFLSLSLYIHLECIYIYIYISTCCNH